MLNLIKMDVYRLVHSVSFRVMFLVVLALAFFSVGMTKLDVDMAKEALEQGSLQEENTVMQVENNEVTLEFGIYMDTQADWAERMPFSELIHESLRSKILLILCVIFVPLFVNAEYKNGYIKNIAGQLPNRGALVVSKLVTAAVQVLLLFAVYLGFSAIAAKIFFKDALVPGEVSELLFSVGLHYLLSLSFSFVILMLTVAVRNSALPMALGILGSTEFTTLIYMGINKLVHVISNSEAFDISWYMPETNMNFISFDMESETLLRVVMVGIVYIVVSAVISMVIMQKRDI